MIYLGSDHGGFKLKEKIKKWLDEWGYQWQDLGNTVFDKEDDYPQFAISVAEKVVEEERKYANKQIKQARGILTCRSAAGVVIAANKVKGARAFTAFDVVSARHGRQHNDANILALSGDWLTEGKAKKILQAFLETEFSSGERHKRRLGQIEEYENKSEIQNSKSQTNTNI